MRQLNDRGENKQITLSTPVATRSSRARTAQLPSCAACKAHPKITPPHQQPYQNSQIPITSRRCPAGSCFGGFRTPAPCLSLGLRWPASENLHHCRLLARQSITPKADVHFGEA